MTIKIMKVIFTYICILIFSFTVEAAPLVGDYVDVGTNNTIDNVNKGSFIAGYGNHVSSHDGSLVVGVNNRLVDVCDRAIVMGKDNYVGSEDIGVFLLGIGNTTRSSATYAIGTYNNLSNFSNSSITIGGSNDVGEYFTISIGRGLIMQERYETALGRYNDQTIQTGETPRLLTIGSGEYVGGEIYRRNSFTVYQDGSIFLGKHHDAALADGELPRLVTIGNGTDSDNRSNAMIIYETGDMALAGDAKLGGGVHAQGDSVFEGEVTIARITPQGDISMGMFGE